MTVYHRTGFKKFWYNLMKFLGSFFGKTYAIISISGRIMMFPLSVFGSAYAGILATSPAFFGITFVASSYVAGLTFGLIVTVALAVGASAYLVISKGYNDKVFVKRHGLGGDHTRD
jgi:hypothetical protein